jgi:hypothetical protein
MAAAANKDHRVVKASMKFLFRIIQAIGFYWEEFSEKLSPDLDKRPEITDPCPLHWMRSMAHADDRGSAKKDVEMFFDHMQQKVFNNDCGSGKSDKSNFKAATEATFVKEGMALGKNLREIFVMAYQIVYDYKKGAGQFGRLLDDTADRMEKGKWNADAELPFNQARILKKYDEEKAYCQKHDPGNKRPPCAKVYAKPGNDPDGYQNAMDSAPDGWVLWRFFARNDGSSRGEGNNAGVQDATTPAVAKTHMHLTPNFLEALDIGLSASEKQNYQDVNFPIDGDTLLIKAQSGILWYVQKDCDCNSQSCQPADPKDQVCEGGFPRVALQTGSRIVAGPSGTTLKMLYFAIALGMPNDALYLLRMGFIGWMVPMEDHSMFEILLSTRNLGLPYDQNSNMYSFDGLFPTSTEHKVFGTLTQHLIEVQTKAGVPPAQRGKTPRMMCSLKVVAGIENNDKNFPPLVAPGKKHKKV